MEHDEPKSDLQVAVGQPVAALPVAGSLARPEFDCWNKIGVSGDGTCQELDKFVHCRNCPVYSAAARQLLDRTPPPDYRRGWVEHFSRPKSRVKPGRLSCVIFRIEAEWLALPTRVFQEVAEQRRIHSLPHRRRDILLGLINIRGQLQLCVSLGRLLGIEQNSARENPPGLCERLVVTQWQDSLLAFPVAEIYGVHRYHAEELKEAPATVAKSQPNFTRGILPWQDRLVGCLDEEPLFTTLNRSLM